MSTGGETEHKIAWGITGAGHFMPEIMELLQTRRQVDLFLSRAAVEVLQSYHIGLPEGLPVFYNRAASAPPVTKLYSGKYRAVVIAPATSNTIAKFVAGISDNLVTNLFAHAGKTKVPIVVLPSDVSGELDSLAPGGMVKVYPRAIDLANVGRLAQFTGVTVVDNMQRLAECLNIYL